jgi:hypothetical protein
MYIYVRTYFENWKRLGYTYYLDALCTTEYLLSLDECEVSHTKRQKYRSWKTPKTPGSNPTTSIYNVKIYNATTSLARF